MPELLTVRVYVHLDSGYTDGNCGEKAVLWGARTFPVCLGF